MGTQKVNHFGAAIICKEKYFRPADGVLVFYRHPFVISQTVVSQMAELYTPNKHIRGLVIDRTRKIDAVVSPTPLLFVSQKVRKIWPQLSTTVSLVSKGSNVSEI